jgi:hypothetical protein
MSVQVKNIHLATIREGLNEIKQWVVENLDAPLNFLSPLKQKGILIMPLSTDVNKQDKE